MREISAFITDRAFVTIRKSEDLRIEPLLERWDASTAAGRLGRRPTCCTGCSTCWSTATSKRSSSSTSRSTPSRTCCSTSSRGHASSSGASFEVRKSLVRAAPGGAADARGRQRAAAAGPRHRRRADAALLPGRLRPRAARVGVDRVAARPGRHHPRDQPDAAGQPAERGDAQPRRLGSDPRGDHRDHRVLRPERPLSRGRASGAASSPPWSCCSVSPAPSTSSSRSATGSSGERACRVPRAAFRRTVFERLRSRSAHPQRPAHRSGARSRTSEIGSEVEGTGRRGWIRRPARVGGDHGGARPARADQDDRAGARGLDAGPAPGRARHQAGRRAGRAVAPPSRSRPS